MRFTHATLTALLVATPLAAQAPDSASIKAQQRIAAILSIPQRAAEIRRSGVPDSTLRGVLDILVKQRVPAEEAAVILEEESKAAAEHGPTDNFGAFVQSQLAAGKRGRELAAAIRAEHQARGKGKPMNAGRAPDQPQAGGGRPATAGGRPAGTAGRAEDPASKAKRAAADTTRGKKPEKRPH
jgi:hypothetical protein